VHRLHVVALPHTTLTEKDITCAYSMKVLKFCGMMKDAGHEVILYGPDESNARCSEHVVITTGDDRERWGFGSEGFDTVRTPFLWDTGQPYWHESNQRAIDAIRERIQPEDTICLVTSCQDPIAQAVAGPGYNNPITVEWAVGYEGVVAPFAAYESYAWMHHVYGLRAQRNGNGHQFDAVIPNFFDPDDFLPPVKKPGDYLFYIGRFIPLKGVAVAADLASRSKRPLYIAGPGVTEVTEGRVSSPEVAVEGDVHYVGQVGFKERAELMANAYAVVVPTLYVEPFGGVAVEAMMSGTPVLASDWGSFTEIVTPEVGRRFRTLKQGVAALEELGSLNRKKIRANAIERYSLTSVGKQFTAWFDSLQTLWGDGYYAT
jgi:glycosyltransferase involved in cell wall biosynthesis